MLENYLIYLEFITKKIHKFFEEQRDYIFCKKGCGKCCKKAQFPYSKIEFELIYQGLLDLKPEIQKEVLDKVDDVIKEKQLHNEQHPDEKFRYDCPFLINNECSVYVYRGLICRTFGLMTFLPNEEKTPNIPFCAYEGLNYSNVLNEVENNISEEKYSQQEHSDEPKAYNVDYKTLINEEIAQGFGFDFGEVKPLIEWFIDWKDEMIKQNK